MLFNPVRHWKKDFFTTKNFLNFTFNEHFNDNERL